ncbi:MAG: T9SS type A sorting domain-containing protein [Candidatus Marinimicrobia bacterium]|nr:T9SS type A sorting domain-containing protein [Candidatus Neomarinimicrobiota bacterium]MCF7828709.1 T9SS type A sorting domain-containing protein [Candidatus Neomarinimicrobiota bacterium]MCF7880450.1 T9SS type A sorting domain-containing protein [Candidatus Neomarinimicrobiota bacterium]
MFSRGITILCSLIFITAGLNAEEIIIQENETGFCNVDGTIVLKEDNPGDPIAEGATGDGYADTGFGVDVSISWSVYAEVAGTYTLLWRYAVGGDAGDRPGELLINGASYLETVNFPHTSEWYDWTVSDSLEVELEAGTNKIRLEAHKENGLGNYDYLKVVGDGISASECTPSYTVSVGQNTADWGTVSYDPVQKYYEEGTEITLTANASDGYFFQSWSGTVPGSTATHTITVEDNIEAEAIFLPEGTAPDPNLVGYAAVQDDKGTPYFTIGGALGDTVTAGTFDELQAHMDNPDPLVIEVAGLIETHRQLSFSSDKTLLGTSENAQLKGIELDINGVRNVIIRNMKIGFVKDTLNVADAVVITGGSKNIWIDHCELLSDRDHGKDYYDGLLDIKNESSFITISWTKLHDHEKVSLIASGDDSEQDSVIRATYHHNYFYNCGSRLPSIRFGRAHLFNNYYQSNSTAINSRMGACVRVERNYFEDVGTAVMMVYSPEKGAVQLIDNHFGDANYSDSPTCELDVPYEYEAFLDATEDVPEIVTGELGVAVEDDPVAVVSEFSLGNYPNPFNAETRIEFSLPNRSEVNLTVYDLRGRPVAHPIAGKTYGPGVHTIDWNASEMPSGIYFYRIRTGSKILTQKMVLLK